MPFPPRVKSKTGISLLSVCFSLSFNGFPGTGGGRREADKIKHKENVCFYLQHRRRGKERWRGKQARRRGKPHRESGTHLVEPHGTHTDTRMHRAKTHSHNPKNALDTPQTKADTHIRPLGLNRINSLDFLSL